MRRRANVRVAFVKMSDFKLGEGSSGLLPDWQEFTLVGPGLRKKMDATPEFTGIRRASGPEPFLAGAAGLP